MRLVDVRPAVIRAANAAAPQSDGLLRRADWRFLLPAPSAGACFEDLVILGATPRLPDVLADLGLARRIASTLPHHGAADAVVVLHNAASALEAAARAVRPGGVFYCEIDRRSRSGLLQTPARVGRALRRAGLTPAAAYWVIRDFDDPRRFIPIHRGRAIQWYFADVLPPWSPQRRIAAWAARFLTGGRGDLFASVVPCFGVVAVKRPVASVVDRPVSIEPKGAERLPSVIADRRVWAAAPADTVALVTSGQDDGSRVVLLPFETRTTKPAIAVKIARHACFNHRTAAEHRALTAVHDRLGGSLADSVPRPGWCGAWNGLAVAVEQCAPGPTLRSTSGAWARSQRARIDDLRAATDWTTAFNRAWCVERQTWSAVRYGQWIEPAIDRYRDVFRTTRDHDRLFAAMRARSATLGGATVPIVLQHNDLGPWNIHRDGDRLTVIDWEQDGCDLSERVGLPVLDLVYFITHWFYDARVLRRADDQLRGFERLFTAEPRDRFVAAATDAIATYVRRLEIDRPFVPVLLVLTWIARALDRLARYGGGSAPPNDPACTRYQQYVDILARRVDYLFDVARHA